MDSPGLKQLCAGREGGSLETGMNGEPEMGLACKVRGAVREQVEGQGLHRRGGVRREPPPAETNSMIRSESYCIWDLAVFQLCL